MCGIAGFFHFDSDREADSKIIERMAAVILHRGPDDEGFYCKRNVALGHRRLAIIDLCAGQQPMYSKDAKNCINL
jgi:asparagine synthase (glutamine-hydrolysing)